MKGRSFKDEAYDSYRFGFNGMEKDDNFNAKGDDFAHYDFGARMYDARLGRWLSRDPLERKYASLSPYNFVANSPLMFVDPNGEYFDFSFLSASQQKYVIMALKKHTSSGVYKNLYEQINNSPNRYIMRVAPTLVGAAEFVGNVRMMDDGEIEEPEEEGGEPVIGEPLDGRPIILTDFFKPDVKGGLITIDPEIFDYADDLTTDEKVSNAAGFLVEELIHAVQYENVVNQLGNNQTSFTAPNGNVEFEAKAIVGQVYSETTSKKGFYVHFLDVLFAHPEGREAFKTGKIGENYYINLQKWADHEKNQYPDTRNDRSEPSLLKENIKP